MTLLNLINHLWQSTAVALAVLALVLAFRGIPARTRRALCWLALAKFAVPLTLIAPFELPLGRIGKWLSLESTTVITAPLPSRGSEDVALAGGATRGVGSSHYRSLSPTEWMLGVWAAGAIGVTALWLIRTSAFRRRILADATPLSTALERRLRAASAKLGLVEAPRGVAVSDEYAPAVVGLIAPVVVLPRSLERDLAPAELESVLLHELVHVQRRDSLVSTIQALAVSALWFNPVAWLLARQLHLESEKSCDERVLELTGDPDTYAGGILKCVHRSLGIPQPLLSIANPPVTDRIKAILNHGQRSDRPILRRLVVGAAMALVSFGGLAGTFAASAPASASGSPTADKTPAVIPPQPAERPAPPPAGWDGVTVFTGPITREMVQQNVAVVPTAAAQPPAPAPVTALAPIITPANVDAITPAMKPGPGSDRLTVDFPETEVRTIVGAVADLFDLNVVIPQALTGRTSIKLRDVTWRQIFQTVLEPVGYTYVMEGNIVKIIPAPVAPPTPKNEIPPDVRLEMAPRGESRGLAGLGEIFDPSKLDNQPIPQIQGKPNFPFEMRRQGTAGTVEVEFIVDSNGDVRSAWANRSTQKDFEAEAVAAVMRWKFKPGRKGGRDVATHMKVDIVFNLNDLR